MLQGKERRIEPGSEKREISYVPNKKELRKHVAELGGYSTLLAYLADAGYDRLSISQAAFFMLAAAADARGGPLTMTQLLAGFGDQLAGAVNNSYRALLAPNRRYPKAIGWLERIPNPDDERESFLVLSEKGWAVIEAALLAAKPMTKGNA